MATATRILTYEEWLALPPVEDGTDEVVKGELRFMPPTRQPHARIIRRLIRILDSQLDDQKAEVFGSNLGLMISREPLTCRSPDIVVYWTEGMVEEDGLHWSAPGLIIEVLSPSENRGRQAEKLADYASIGVPEVWLVSPQAETVEVLLLKDGEWQRLGIFMEGSIQPTEFPEVDVFVPAIFRKVSS